MAKKQCGRWQSKSSAPISATTPYRRRTSRNLINDVHQALVKAGEPVAPAQGEPAVPVRQSVKADHLVCLECGQRFALLKRHLRVDHQTTPLEYRRKWGLPPTYPVVAPDYAKVRSRLAKQIGLGRLPGNTGRTGTRRPAR